MIILVADIALGENYDSNKNSIVLILSISEDGSIISLMSAIQNTVSIVLLAVQRKKRP